MILEDLVSTKTIVTCITAPITFLLGLVGFHYKSVLKKIDTIDFNQDELKVKVAEHNLMLAHMNESNFRIESKLDALLEVRPIRGKGRKTNPLS